MASYRDLLARTKSEIREIEARDLDTALESGTPPLLVDVRELDEFEQGAIPGAVHIPRGFLESRIEGVRHNVDLLLSTREDIVSIQDIVTEFFRAQHARAERSG